MKLGILSIVKTIRMQTASPDLMRSMIDCWQAATARPQEQRIYREHNSTESKETQLQRAGHFFQPSINGVTCRKASKRQNTMPPPPPPNMLLVLSSKRGGMCEVTLGWSCGCIQEPYNMFFLSFCIMVYWNYMPLGRFEPSTSALGAMRAYDPPVVPHNMLFLQTSKRGCVCVTRVWERENLKGKGALTS